MTFKHFVEEDKIYLAIVKMHFKQKRVSINVALVADIFFLFRAHISCNATFIAKFKFELEKHFFPIGRLLLPHCSKSSFFVQKFNFDFPRKVSIFWGEKLVNM